MFRRKGLFWYNKKSRFFDFSTSISGNQFGYGSSVISQRIKNSIKKNTFFYTSNNHYCDYIKSQFSLWIRHHPSLSDYQFYLISDLDLIHFFRKHFTTKIIARPWEEEDHLLYYLNGGIAQTRKTIITENVFDYPDESESNDLNKMNNRDTCLYLNSYFPSIPSLNGYGTQLLFYAIIVGGAYPFGLNGQKILLLKDGEEKNIPSRLPPINHWHLKVYQDGISHYYNLLKKPGHKDRLKAFERTLIHFHNFRNQGKAEEIDIQVTSSIPFKAQITVKRKVNFKALDKNTDFKNHRLFYANITIVTDANSDNTIFYIHLPINFPPHHLENKWKALTKFFTKILKE